MTTAAAGAPARPFRIVWVLAFGSFAVGTGLFVLSGVLPELAASLHTSVAAAGQSVTVFAVTYAVAAPVLATVAGRFPVRGVMVVALAVFTVGNVLTAISPSIPVLFLSRVLAALGSATFSPVALGAAAAVVPLQQRGRALATVQSGLNGSLAVGVPLGIVLARISTWRSAVVLVTVLGFASIVAIAVLVRALPPIPRTSLTTTAKLAASPRIVPILLVSVLSVAAGISAYTYLAEILKATISTTTGTLLVLLVLYGVGAFVGTLTSGQLTDRFGARRSFDGAIVVLLAVLLLLPVLHALAPVAVAMVVWGAAFVATTPPQQVELVTAAPDHATVAVSLNSSAIYVGQATGAALGGLLLSLTGTPVSVPFLAAALAATALATHLAVTRGGSQRLARTH